MSHDYREVADALLKRMRAPAQEPSQDKQHYQLRNDRADTHIVINRPSHCVIVLGGQVVQQPKT